MRPSWVPSPFRPSTGGRHDLTIESLKGVMLADETDVFNLTVLEI